MTVSIETLWLYPIKGCGGFTVPSAVLAPTGLEVNGIGDREWVVVDDDHEFLSQRELPKMALIETRLTADSLRVKAPEMLQLEVPFETEGEVVSARVWNDAVGAVTQGTLVDEWFSQFLGQRCSLLRFDPEGQRLSNRKYTGAAAAPYKFADAFSLLVCSSASLADLNARLDAQGQPTITIERFRPNIVLDGIEAFDEDYIDRLTIGSEARLQVVKPCVRCTVPNVDLKNGQVSLEPGATLAAYRTRVDAGGITFGVNAIVAAGAGTQLSVRDPVELTLTF